LLHIHLFLGLALANSGLQSRCCGCFLPENQKKWPFFVNVPCGHISCVGCAASSSSHPSDSGTLCVICKEVVLQAHQVNVQDSFTLQAMTGPEVKNSDAEISAAIQRLHQNLSVRKV
jgi:hypothetical protein